MLSRIAPLLRRLLGFFALVFAVSLGGFSRGQDGLPAGEAVEKDYVKHRTNFIKLLSGSDPFDANNKMHAAILDSGAKYVTYRLTVPGFDVERGKMDEIYHDLETQLQAIGRNKTNQQEMAKVYTKAVMVRAREVINFTPVGKKPDIVRINAARELAKLADLGQGELADVLLDVFNQEIARDADPTGPKRNDGVVYYMLKGMRELLAQPIPMPPAKPALTPAQEKKLSETLVAFVAKAPPFSNETPEEEVEGYRVVRREAVRGLAYCRAPGMKDKERPGMTLLRIMARDGFTPPPRIDECVEAAIGVARMRATPELDGKDYQPEYAAFQMAQFTDYYVKYYLSNIYDPQEKTKLVEQRPYRIYAARMREALEAMKAADAKNAYVPKAVDECRKLLVMVEKGEMPKTLELEEWLKNNPPPKQGLFQGVADSTVKPANRP